MDTKVATGGGPVGEVGDPPTISEEDPTHLQEEAVEAAVAKEEGQAPLMATNATNDSLRKVLQWRLQAAALQHQYPTLPKGTMMQHQLRLCRSFWRN